MQIVRSQPIALGVPFGVSKQAAVDAYTEAGNLIQDAKALAANYPKAQSAIGFWAKFMPIEAQYYKDRDYVFSTTAAVTAYSKYVEQAKRYAEKFYAVMNELQAKAVELGEKRADNDYRGGPPGAPGSDEDNTMLYVGIGVALVAAIGIAIALNRPKTASAVAGLRRRRRR